MTEPASTVDTARKSPLEGARVLRDHAEPYRARDATNPPDSALELAERLGGDTLALRLLGRLIREHPVTVGGYRGALRTLDAAERAIAPGIAQVHRPLALVCEMSMSLLDHGVLARARPLLAVLSFLGAEGVRVPMRRLEAEALRGTIVDTGAGALDTPALELSIGTLAAHGFVNRRWVGEEPTVALHPLVSEVIREWLGERALEAAAATSVLLARGDGGDFAMEDAAYRCVLNVRERALGAEHPDALWTRHRLAALEARRGDLTKAETSYRKVLDTQRRVLGAEHPDTLWTRQRLAWVAARRGNLTEAEAGYREVLDTQRRVLGAEHPYTRLTQEALADIMRQEWSG